MKKGKIVGLSLLSALLVFSFINISHAAPSYVGINTGDSYIWTATTNMENINATAIAIFGAANWSLAYMMLDLMLENITGFGLDEFFGVAIKALITNVTDELPLLPGVNGVGVFGELSVALAPNNWTVMNDPLDPIAVILDPTNINSTNFMYYIGMGGYPLFLPKGFPFTSVAPWMNAAFAGMPPVYSNITFSGLTDGFEITILGDFLEWTINASGAPFPIPSLGNFIATAQWNENGVLKYASIEYASLVLAEFTLAPFEGEIPGYIIPVSLGVGTIAVVSIIYIIRKKKRII